MAIKRLRTGTVLQLEWSVPFHLLFLLSVLSFSVLVQIILYLEVHYKITILLKKIPIFLRSSSSSVRNTCRSISSSIKLFSHLVIPYKAITSAWNQSMIDARYDINLDIAFLFDQEFLVDYFALVEILNSYYLILAVFSSF